MKSEYKIVLGIILVAVLLVLNSSKTNPAFVDACDRLGGIVLPEYHNPQNGICIATEIDGEPVVLLDEVEWEN